MPSTTTNYGFTYPLNGDDANTFAGSIGTGLVAIDAYIQGSLVKVATDTTSAAQSTVSTSYVDKTDCQTSITVGKSGIVLAILTANPYYSSLASVAYASIRFSGAKTQAASDNEALQSPSSGSIQASHVQILTGCTAGATLTATLALRNGTGGSGTTNVSFAKITLVTIG